MTARLALLAAAALVLAGCGSSSGLAGNATIFVKKVGVDDRTVTCIVANGASGTGVDCDWEGSR